MKNHTFLLCVAALLLMVGGEGKAYPHPLPKGKGARAEVISPPSFRRGKGEAANSSFLIPNSTQFRRVDTSGNLSGDYVRSIVRDRYGAIWLLMMTHVERYDGHRFHHYEVNGMPQGGDALHDIVLTADGRLWITGTSHNYVYHEREDCIRRTDAADFTPYGIAQDTVGSIFVDGRQDLWCRSAGDGPVLYHYNFATRRLTHTDVSGAGAVIGLTLVHDRAYVLTATADRRCALWTATPGRQTLTPVTHLDVTPSDRTRIYADSQGRIWLYALNETMLWQFDSRTSVWTDATQTLPLAGAMMTALIDDGDGNLWMGTGNRGICILDAKGSFTTIRQDGGAPFKLVDNHINCFFRDSETTTMWVGTSKQGVVFCNQALTSFSIAHMPAGDDVSCLDADPDGRLWMGFDSQGAASVENSLSFSRLTTRHGGLSSNQVVCTLRDSQGRRWWGSYGGDLLYFDAGNRPHRIADRRLQQVISMQEDADGLIWVGTFYDGAYLLDPATNHIARSITPADSPLSTGCISQLLWDGSRHRLYMATNDGLYAFDGDTLRCLMQGTSIRSILLTTDSRTLWAGLDNGLVAYDPDKSWSCENKRAHPNAEPIATLTVRDGLSHNTIFALAEDDYHSIWASTKHGISRITPTRAGYRCTAYKETDGMGGISFNPHATTRLSDGTILMGALGSIVTIKPHPDIPATPHTGGHSTFFTTLFINGERVEVGTPLNDGRIVLRQNLLMTERIDLRHDDTSVTIEVSDMNCLLPHQHFQYRLGREGDWHDLEGNTIILNDLHPGTYQLQARTATSAAAADSMATLTIRVAQPWYLTRLAVILYVLLATTLLLLLLRHRRQRLRQRSANERREMVLRQQQQTDEAKMRFFTNVSHDMRTPLSLIVTPLSRLLQRSDIAPDVRNQLQLIRHSADTLQEEITQLLDYRRLEQTPGTLNPTRGPLREFVRIVCQPFTESELQGGVTLTTVLPPDDPMEARFDHAKTKRVLVNLISNAIKYNRPGGTVTVALNRDGSDAVIRVTDQGIGIRPENRERIFERFYQEPHDDATGTAYTGSGIGLHLVRQYVTMMGGTVTVAPAIPKGSTFIVRLPLVEESEVKNTSSSYQIDRLSTKTSDDSVESEPLAEHSSASLKSDVCQSSPEPEENTLFPPAPILVVEDNDDFRTFLRSCLESHYSVATAANGHEALALLGQQDVRLIISDIMMPVMDGMTLCRRVKGDLRYSHIPFIMLSARTADQQQAEGLGEGADDYITKPFNLDILLLRIERILRWAEGARDRFQQLDVKPSELTVSRVDERLIAEAIEQVETNIADPDYSVEQLAAALAMSRSGLYKKLMAITGLSPLLFIRTLRIKRGRQLLEKSGESVSQIAYHIGLSPKQFAKYFREAYGILPSEFVVKQNKA
ncbi:MAG: response regulator [Bacteroidaceae bacterium]|nr:response regulator [Bacteroidaceae bacterium]